MCGNCLTFVVRFSGTEEGTAGPMLPWVPPTGSPGLSIQELPDSESVWQLSRVLWVTQGVEGSLP